MADIDAPLAWRMQQDGYLMQINQLRDENAKLRKLCADLYAAMLAYSKVQPTTQAYWATRLGELRIEVPNGEV